MATPAQCREVRPPVRLYIFLHLHKYIYGHNTALTDMLQFHKLEFTSLNIMNIITQLFVGFEKPSNEFLLLVTSSFLDYI